jgi:hypothetical protein
MTSSGTDSAKLKRVIVILSVACALLVGVVAGIAITTAISNAPDPIESGEVAPPIGTVTPTPSLTPTPSPTPSASATKKKAVAVGPAASNCPTGGLTVSFSGMVANNNDGIVKVLAGYRLTNTSNRYTMVITRNSLVNLELLTAGGANKGTIRGINPNNILVDAGGIKTMALTHEGYQVLMWNQSSKLHVEDDFKNIEVKWMNSNCKVPITVGNTSKAIAPFQLNL